jgi:hypothetical protein
MLNETQSVNLSMVLFLWMPPARMRVTLMTMHLCKILMLNILAVLHGVLNNIIIATCRLANEWPPLRNRQAI